jgi:hypothetical protein
MRWVDVLSCIGYTILGAFVGKIIGIGYARIKLISYTKTILEKLNYHSTMRPNILNS